MNRTELGLWRERLLAMNLILPILEIEIIGEALWLISAPWRRFSEARKAARRRACSAPEPPEPDEYDLLVTLACLDDTVAREALLREQADRA